MAFGLDDVFTGGLSTLLDMGESAWNNYLSNKSAKKAAERNYQYSLRYLQNAPSSQVQGLREAGLNPILAVSGGFSGSSPSQFSGTPATPSDSSSFAQGVSASSNRRFVDAQIKAQESVIDKNNADAERSRAEAEYIRTHKSYSTPSGAISTAARQGIKSYGELYKQMWRYLKGDDKPPVKLARPIPEEYFYNTPASVPGRERADTIPRSFWDSLEKTSSPSMRVRRNADGSRDYFFESGVEKPKKKGYNVNVR